MLVNTLTANCEYSRGNLDNLGFPTQLKLSKKPLTFCHLFFLIFGVYMKFPMFLKKIKNEPHRSSISEVTNSEGCAYLNS